MSLAAHLNSLAQVAGVPADVRAAIVLAARTTAEGQRLIADAVAAGCRMPASVRDALAHLAEQPEPPKPVMPTLPVAKPAKPLAKTMRASASTDRSDRYDLARARGVQPTPALLISHWADSDSDLALLIGEALRLGSDEAQQLLALGFDRLVVPKWVAGL